MIHASDITFGGTLFVAVGYSSDVMVSSDGLNWTIYKNVLGRSNESYGARVFYTGAQFICCTGENQVFASTDAETWNATPLGNACWAGCYGNGNLILMPYGAANVYGTDSTSASMQIHAHDGVLASLDLPSTQTLSVLHLNEEKKIVVSTDADGLTWEHHESSVQFYSNKVLYGNGLYLAFSYNRSVYSVDGVNWNLGGYGNFIPFEPACFGGGKFVSLSYVQPFGTHSFVSDDGETWKDSEAVAGGTPIDLCYAKGQFVGLFGMNDGIVVAVSETGENWETASAMPTIDDGWVKIMYGNGIYVAITRLATAPNGGAIAYSKDLISWTVIPVNELIPHYTVSSPFIYLYDICFSGDRFVAVGDNGVQISLCSYDGITWDVYSNEHSGQNIIFAQGWFLSVSAGSAGKSKDGINWTACDSPLPESSSVNFLWLKLAFGGSFVCVDNVNAYTSSGFVNKTEIPLDFSFDSISSLQMEGSQTCDYVLVSQNELTSTVRNNILSEPSYHGKYSDTVNLRDEIMELSTTRNTLFLKSRKGDLLEIRISAAVEVSTMDNSPTQAQTAKISWVEVGSTDDARIVITKSDGAWPY